MSTVSICIPTRNRAHLLARHLDHISRFSRLDCEVVVSDNNSTDDTAATVDRFRDRIAQLYYVKQPNSLSFFETISAACNLAVGDYVMYGADDDFLVEDGLLSGQRILDQNPRLSAVYGSWESRDEESGRILNHFQRRQEQTIYTRSDLLTIYQENWWIELPFFRRAVYQRSHLPTTHLLPFDFHGLALFLRHGDVMFTPDVMMQVSHHPGQNSRALYRDDIVSVYLHDLELYIQEMPEEMCSQPLETLLRKLVPKYLNCVKSALADGRLLRARHFLLKALAYHDGDARRMAEKFEAECLDLVVAEALEQAILLAQPVRHIVATDDPALVPVLEELQQLQPDLKLTILPAEEVASRVPRDDEYYVVCDAGLLRHAEGMALAIRKGRVLADVVAACRVLPPHLRVAQ
jgi:hypothetical protein